jgi:3-phosphoshikimate 1-carboxyvinyltransferase
MSTLVIEPFTRPFALTFTPPGSKSLTNRAMILAALGRGTCVLRNALFADDTRVMIDGLTALGFDIRTDENKRTISITGTDGIIPNKSASLFCGNSGTTIRFLAALCAVGRGEYILDGIARMRKRPIGPLTTMLRNLGTEVQSTMADGFPPLRVRSNGFAGGIVRYGSEVSSQYLSAILQVAPYARHEVVVDLQSPQTSWPYVAMTMQLMSRFHCICELVRDPITDEPQQIFVPRGHYSLSEYVVEPDASNASYFLALAAIHPGAGVTIEGLGKQSLQGDVGFAGVLKKMGATVDVGNDFITVQGPDALQGIDIDLSTMPDTAQTLAVTALFATGPTIIRGLHTLRVKETDRIDALQRELTKLGAGVNVEHDVLHITPPVRMKAAQIDTYDDHRMAMSFAIAATRSAGIVINDPQCVNKTYPGFFEDLKRFENVDR